jgi:hypothetical protein
MGEMQQFGSGLDEVNNINFRKFNSDLEKLNIIMLIIYFLNNNNE